MALKIWDVYVAMFALEGSLEAVDGKAAGPLADVGNYLGYRDLFVGSRTGAGSVSLPWDPKAPAANLFWCNYVTERMSAEGTPEAVEANARLAWEAMVPLMGTSGLKAGEPHPRLRPVFSEAFAWPTALGFCRNYSIRDGVEPSELGEILAAGRDFQRRHEALDSIRKEFWGQAAAGQHSNLTTIVSVVRADPESAPREKDEEALKALLDSLDVKTRPRILSEDDLAAEGDPGVYCADNFRLIWVPGKFRASGPIHSIGCFHRNLVFGSLQAQMLAVTALELYDRRENGQLPSRYTALRVRLGECDRHFWSPFHLAWLEGKKVQGARKALGL